MDRLRPDGEAVARADRLGRDLAEHDDGQRREDDGDQAGGEVVQQDREDGIDEHVPQQDAAEEVVAVVADRLDDPRVLPLLGRAGVAEDLELGAVEGHEAQVQAGEERGEAQADDDDHYGSPDGEELRVGLEGDPFLGALVDEGLGRVGVVALLDADVERVRVGR